MNLDNINRLNELEFNLRNVALLIGDAITNQESVAKNEDGTKAWMLEVNTPKLAYLQTCLSKHISELAEVAKAIDETKDE